MASELSTSVPSLLDLSVCLVGQPDAAVAGCGAGRYPECQSEGQENREHESCDGCCAWCAELAADYGSLFLDRSVEQLWA